MRKTDFDINRKSRPVIIIPYQNQWPAEFQQLGRRIRTLVGNRALRIDHIGSTAVPGLSAKDVIDIQITVPRLDDTAELCSIMGRYGFRLREDVRYDLFRGMDAEDIALQKRYMREPAGERRVHIHIREQGRFNQRYALLFRDYLRANDTLSREYEILKQRAARLFPDSIDGYLYLKDPVFHIIFEAAEAWAQTNRWQQNSDYL